jgi:hypothetical protein
MTPNSARRIIRLVDEYNKQVYAIKKKDYSELVERPVSLKQARAAQTSLVPQ